MSFDVKSAIVRFISSNGDTLGTGFVLTDNGLIATCAHVVQSEESQQNNELRPNHVNLVFYTNDRDYRARVEPKWWSPTWNEDVAVLQLQGELPKSVQPVPLSLSSKSKDHSFETFGFPEVSPEDGIIGVGEILGETTIRDGPVLQLASEQVTPGFSGAPILDKTAQQVVGMVTAITPPDKYKRQAVTAFATRTETLVELCPELESILQLPREKQDIDPERLKEYLCGIQDEFIKHMRGDERIDDEHALGHYVELLIREREKEKKGKNLYETKSIQEGPISNFLEASKSRLLVFGEGGSGKTTLLRKLASDAAGRALVDSVAPIPVYVKLNAFDTKERGLDEMMQMISDVMGVDKQEMKTLWREGRRPFLFLLDSFNEVKREFQHDCVGALQELMRRDNHCYVVSSRPGGRAENLPAQIDGITAVDIIPLDMLQVQSFLTSYNASGIYYQMSGRIKDLVRNPFILWALTQSWSKQSEGKLPSNIGELYRAFIDDYIFGKREKSKSPPPTRYNYLLVKKPVLASLAWMMTQAGVTRSKEDLELLKNLRDMLIEIRNKHEGLIEDPEELMPERPVAKSFLNEVVHNGILRRVDDRIEFMHQSVQEYFTAVKLSNWAIDDILSIVNSLVWRHIKPDLHQIDRFEDSFSVPLIMLSGLLADGTSLLTLLNRKNPLLAAHCLTGATYVNTSVRQNLYDSWLTMLNRRHERYRWIACQCLQNATPNNVDVAFQLVDVATKDPNRYVKDAAALALSKTSFEKPIRKFIEKYLAFSYEEKKNMVGRDVAYYLFASEIAFGVLFDIWRNIESDDDHRYKASRMIASMSRKFVMVTLKAILQRAEESGDDDLKDDIVLFKKQLPRTPRLGMMPAREAREITLAARERKRKLAKSFYSKKISQLAELSGDSDPLVRSAVVQVLGEHATNDAVSLLRDCLIREPDGFVRRKIVIALTEFSNELDVQESQKVVYRLLDTLYTEADFSVRESIVIALAKFGSGLDVKMIQELTDSLLYSLSLEDNKIVTQEIIKVLDRLGDKKKLFSYLTRQLLNAKNDVNMRVRISELAILFGKQAIPILIDLIKDKNPTLKIQGVSMLGKIGGEEIAELLIELLKNEKFKKVKEATIQALGETKSVKAIIPLIEVLKQCRVSDEDFEDYSFPSEELAIDDALNKLDKSQVLNELENAMNSKNSNTRVIITDQLGNFLVKDPTFPRMGWEESGSQITDLLLKSLADSESKVRMSAVVQIGRLEGEITENLLVETALTDSDQTVRNAAAKELRWFDGMSAVNRLIHTLEATDKVRCVVAADALGFIEDEAAVEPLLVALRDESSYVRVAAAVALERMKADVDVDLIGILVEIVSRDSNEISRQQAARALVHMQSSEGKTILFDLIRNVFKSGNYKELLTLIGDISPPDASILWARGYSYFQLRQFDKALADCDLLLSVDSTFSMFYDLRSKTLRNLNRLGPALIAARKAVELSPDNADYQFHLGWCAYLAGYYKESISSSKRALEINPQGSGSAFNLGLALLASDQINKAKIAYQQGIKIWKSLNAKKTTEVPFDDEVLCDLDELLNSRIDLESAIREFKQLLEEAKDSLGSQDAS